MATACQNTLLKQFFAYLGMIGCYNMARSLKDEPSCGPSYHQSECGDDYYIYYILKCRVMLESDRVKQ